jgi:hypothetical protein
MWPRCALDHRNEGRSTMKRLLLAVAAVLAACAAAAGQPQPRDPIIEWLEAIKQGPERTPWLQVPWLTDLAEAQRTAREEKRPLLLWGSDDEPLDRC